MSYRFLSLFLLLLAFSFSGKAQKTAILNKPFAQRYQALDTTYNSGQALKQDSVAFFNEVVQLEVAAQKAGDDELVLGSVRNLFRDLRRSLAARLYQAEAAARAGQTTVARQALKSVHHFHRRRHRMISMARVVHRRAKEPHHHVTDKLVEGALVPEQYFEHRGEILV